MSCDNLFRTMGFHCIERRPGIFRVFSPITFPDGEPIGWYAEEAEKTVTISDNANTLFRLRSVGLDVSERNKWRSVKHIVESFGMKLKDSGEIIGVAQSVGAAKLVSNYIGAMLSISELEREVHEVTVESADFVEEVGARLLLWKPDSKLDRRPSVTGHSGRVHRFDFLFDDELVEAARPNPTRTGSILRKSTDVKNADNPPSILVVMDDRDDPERADYEIRILNSIVRVLPFSRLANNLSGAPEVRH